MLPGTWLYESQSAVYHYSPERALQYLYDSGWKDLNGDTVLDRLNGIQLEELTVNIITYNKSAPRPSVKTPFISISNYLNAVGIKTRVEVLSKEKAASRIKDRDFDLALIGVNLSEVPILQPLLSSDGSLNLNGYGDDWMDGWIGETSTESDRGAAEGALQQHSDEGGRPAAHHGPAVPHGHGAVHPLAGRAERHPPDEHLSGP